VDIIIRNIPDALLTALRRRAAAHGRSVEDEVLDTLRNSLQPTRRLSFSQFAAEAGAEGRATPAEAAAMVREDRDERRRA